MFDVSIEEVAHVKNNKACMCIYPQLICSICRHSLRMSKTLSWKGNCADRRKC